VRHHKKARKSKIAAISRVSWSALVEEEAWINYRGCVHDQLNKTREILDPCKEWNRIEFPLLKRAEICILKKTIGGKKKMSFIT
jgi:hypothetical protein